MAESIETVARPKLTERRKAAVLLSLLEPDEAAEVLRHLRPHEVESLVKEVATLEAVEETIVRTVIDEGLAQLQSDTSYLRGGLDRARDLVTQAFGMQKGATLWAQLEAAVSDVNSAEPDPELLAKLSNVPPLHLVELVRDEHPQAIALLLSFLTPSHGGAVLSALDPEVRGDVAQRLLVTEPPPAEVLDTVRRSLQDAIAPAAERSATTFNGLKVLTQILSNVPRELSQEVIATIEQKDTALADRVVQALFTFEDLINLDDRSLQRVLREIESSELAVALKGVSDRLRQKIFDNMSQRAAAMLNDEIEFMGPVRMRDVMTAQRTIVDAVRRLEDAGEITVPGAGEELVA